MRGLRQLAWRRVFVRGFVHFQPELQEAQERRNSVRSYDGTRYHDPTGRQVAELGDLAIGRYSLIRYDYCLC
jgi:hypothetical protein